MESLIEKTIYKLPLPDDVCFKVYHHYKNLLFLELLEEDRRMLQDMYESYSQQALKEEELIEERWNQYDDEVHDDNYFEDYDNYYD